MKLQAKFLMILSPLALGAAGLISFSSMQAVHSILCAELAQKGIQAGEEQLPRLNALMLEQDESALLVVLNSLLKRTNGSYAAVLDQAGMTLAHTNVLEKGKIRLDEATQKALRASAPAYRQLLVKGEPILEVSIPIWAPEKDFLLAAEPEGRRRLGLLRIGLPLKGTTDTQHRIFFDMTFILLGAGALMALVFIFFLKKVLFPVHLLAESAAKIGGGHYGALVPVISNDEIGELARSFNQMSENLAATTVSKDYLDSIINHMTDSLIVADPEGSIRMVNQAAAKLLGYSEAELHGRPLDQIFPPDKDFDCRMLMKKEGSPNLEISLRDKNGNPISALVSSSTAQEKDGKASAVVIVARDIRERKTLEARMSQTEKLSAIGQLAAGVAHEINNPLGVILGFSQSIVKRLAAGDALEMPLKSIERESLRCKELVQSLLTFSRQDKKLEESFDLGLALKGALALVETQARVKSVELKTDLCAEPLISRGNPNQIQQIVINLCSNAMDAMPGGGGLTVALRQVAENGRPCAQLQVKDTGTGIPKEIQDKIFVPFFTTKETGKGTGLGLALVYELVSAHNGRVDFTSAPGGGTTFRVLLPLSLQN